MAKNNETKKTKASAKAIASRALVIFLALVFIGSTVVAVLPAFH